MEAAAARAGVRTVKDALTFGAGYAVSRQSSKTNNSQEKVRFGDDEIYFGSKRVFLQHVEGSTTAYEHKLWKPVRDKTSVDRVLSRADSIGPKNDIVVPAIPALDISGGEAFKDTSKWPTVLRKPLIKVGKNMPPEAIKPTKGITKSFASGVRSAVLCVGGEWYRLKGCGNNDEGFVVKTDLDRKKNRLTHQIRGCAWMHTAVRENFMTADLAKRMESNGVFGANEAFGVYQYGRSNRPFGDKVSIPACIVERTRGDRRLGSHVLAGLSLLMPSLLDIEKLDADKLCEYFPEVRRKLAKEEETFVTTAQLMTDHMLAFEGALHGFASKGSHGLSFNVPRDQTLFADGARVPLPHRKLVEGSYPKQWERGGPKPMEAPWRPLWDDLVREYNALLAKAGKDANVLGYLFSRLGSDCGKIIRGMHDARVSWGTYQDALCVCDSQWHCNAHANNCVVLSEGSCVTDMFLGYLDLDMAFDDKTFVSVYGKGSPRGTIGVDKDVHDLLLRREHVNFLEVVAGADASTGVPSVARDVVDEQPECVQLSRCLLYDASVLAYLREYDGNTKLPCAKFDADLHRLSYVLIKLAIIVMADFVA